MVKDKIIVVTGGAGVLGRSFARAIAEQGGIAVVADIDTEASNRVAEEILSSYRGRVLAASLDITVKESVCALIADIKEKYGHIDAVVNNAYPRNCNYGRKLEEVTYADFCANTSLHLGGYFLVAQQFGLYFRAQGAGNIINMSSIYGTKAPRFELYAGTPMTMPVEYAAIKAAIIQLTCYFAQYFKGDHIRVNSLSPGGISGNQPDSFLKAYNAFCNEKGMLDPVDITGSLLFLLSDESKYVTGQNIIVDDGFNL
jgi:NAD(P)-dependent dehydrogenase (short-subunit alcohol dehydrogenase family)